MIFATQYKQTDLCNGDVAYWATAPKAHTPSTWISGCQVLLWSLNYQVPKNPCRVRKKDYFQSNYRKLVDRIFLRIREVPRSNLGSENCYPDTKCALPPHQGNVCAWNYTTTGFMAQNLQFLSSCHSKLQPTGWATDSVYYYLPWIR